jgi:hypothetical protein
MRGDEPMKIRSGQLHRASSSNARQFLFAAVLLSALVARPLSLVAQTPEKIKTEYKFRLTEKGPDLVFRVALDEDRVPKSVSVFHPGESTPFQTMENCARFVAAPEMRHPNSGPQTARLRHA